MAVLKYYDGSDWEPVASALVGPTGSAGVTGATGPTGSDASSGLTLISTTSFSAVTSASINNVFSATYENYKVYLNITSFASAPSIIIRMRASGSDNSSSNYKYSGIRINSSNAAVDGINSGASTTSFALLGTGTGGNSLFASLEFLQPFATQKTSYSTNAFPEGGYGYVGNGRMTVTTSYDGLTFISDDGNIAGTVSVYGYNK